MFATAAPTTAPAAPGGTTDADAALRALAAAVDEVLAADPAGWSDESLAAAMVELRRQQARLAAAVVEATAAFDARRAWATTARGAPPTGSPPGPGSPSARSVPTSASAGASAP
jgi:hypothetical protein